MEETSSGDEEQFTGYSVSDVEWERRVALYDAHMGVLHQRNHDIKYNKQFKQLKELWERQYAAIQSYSKEVERLNERIHELESRRYVFRYDDRVRSQREMWKIQVYSEEVKRLNERIHELESREYVHGDDDKVRSREETLKIQVYSEEVEQLKERISELESHEQARGKDSVRSREVTWKSSDSGRDSPFSSTLPNDPSISSEDVAAKLEAYVSLIQENDMMLMEASNIISALAANLSNLPKLTWRLLTCMIGDRKAHELDGNGIKINLSRTDKDGRGKIIPTSTVLVENGSDIWEVDSTGAIGNVSGGAPQVDVIINPEAINSFNKLVYNLLDSILRVYESDDLHLLHGVFLKRRSGERIYASWEEAPNVPKAGFFVVSKSAPHQTRRTYMWSRLSNVGTRYIQ